MTTVAQRSSLRGLAQALLELGAPKSNNSHPNKNNNHNNDANIITSTLNKRTAVGGTNRNNKTVKHVHFQVSQDDHPNSEDDEEDEEEEDDNDNENNENHHPQDLFNNNNNNKQMIQNNTMSNKRMKKTIVIYVTSGVKGGLAGRKALMAKFRHAVQIDTRSMELSLPEWKDVPSPLDITCGVSDDLDEKHTRSLMAQGVLMVKSSWILHCITEKRLLVPVNEDRFALRPDHPVWAAQKTTKTPLVRVTESSYYASSNIPGHIKNMDHGGKPVKPWKKHQDEVIRVIHQAKVRGQFARANQFETLLKSTGKNVEEIHAREKHLFGWSADLLLKF